MAKTISITSLDLGGFLWYNRSMNESWISVPRDGRYEVSTLGRIRRSWACRGATVGKVLSPFINKNGYLCVTLGKYGKQPRVHCLVAEAFLGLRPLGYEINHKNADKTDNRVENLEYVTQEQNLEHARSLGLLGRKPKSNFRTKQG